MSGRGAGVGSMPGTDFGGALRTVADMTPDLVALPELPTAGVNAQLPGRGLAVAGELPVDLTVDGWTLAYSHGSMARQARRLIVQEMDLAEEVFDGASLPLKVQVAGPWTLSAVTLTRNGARLLGDVGARRDLAQALAHGVEQYIGELNRRLKPSSLVVQIDEPGLPAVALGAIGTASGLSRYAAIDLPELDEALGMVTAAIKAGGASSAAHCCAPKISPSLFAGAGFDAINFDLSLATPGDEWAAAFESGVDLWPGAIATSPESSDKAVIAEIEGFFGQLGFDRDSFADRLVVTPTCGLAGSSPAQASAALAAAQRVATM